MFFKLSGRFGDLPVGELSLSSYVFAALSGRSHARLSALTVLFSLKLGKDCKLALLRIRTKKCDMAERQGLHDCPFRISRLDQKWLSFNILAVEV